MSRQRSAREGEILVTAIMPVFNAKAYLDAAVGSVLHQTIGKDRILFVLVDDGSTDGSGELCDRYAEKYPDSVTVVHKENGGPSSARNAGIPFIRGRYVTFPDSDDILAGDAMEKMCAFMDTHPEADVCCIPIRLFGHKSGEHPLNYKFESGTRLVDVSKPENADCILLSGAAALYRADAARSMVFDSRLLHAEDAKVNMTIFLKNPRLGIISDTVYHYRKHGKSIIDGKELDKRTYIPYLKLFSEWALDTAEKRFGSVPGFVQHAVMYDLQWKFLLPHMRKGVLSEEEETEFRNDLNRVIGRIDDGVILAQRRLEAEHKLHALRIKYGHAPETAFSETGERIGGMPVGDAVLRFGQTVAEKASGMRAVLEFAEEDARTGRITLEGYHVLYGGLEDEEVKPYLIVNGRAVECERTDRSREESTALDERIAVRAGFRMSLPSESGAMEIRPALLIRGLLVPKECMECGKHFPLSTEYENMRAYVGGRMLSLEHGRLFVRRIPAWIGRTAGECALLFEIWKKNGLGGRKAVAGRLAYHFLSPFKRRKLWIVSDRIKKADDNGEAFFRYLMEHRPKHTRILFAISKKSPDAARLKRIGPCVDSMSFRHKLLHLLCDVNISSQADAMTVNPFVGHDAALRDLLERPRFVFLQHGITKDDVSEWLGKPNMNISGFVTAAGPEYRSIRDGAYGYSPERIWLTGFPRYDLLREKTHPEKTIVVMPTWRKYLMASRDNNTGRWKAFAGYERSAYVRFYEGLFTEERLLDGLEKLGYRLVFFPHPNIRLSDVTIRTDPRVRVLSSEAVYRDVFETASMVVTDYSSAVFDFAYLHKPLIYCQFDREEFFSGAHYKKGYFDYDRDGFGEVERDLDSTVDRILEYAGNGCRIKELYAKRVDGFFAYRDSENSRRVLDRILAMREGS